MNEEEFSPQEIERDGAKTLVFEGKLIASVSSRTPSKSRWTEIDLWMTLSGTYVLHTRGCSSVRGERTFHRGTIHNDAATLFTQLEDRSRTISDLGYQLLEIAAERRPDIDTAFDEYESEPAVVK